MKQLKAVHKQVFNSQVHIWINSPGANKEKQYAVKLCYPKSKSDVAFSVLC